MMDLNIYPPMPEKADWRIGVLGAGFIVNDCHLPAYRKAGFNPVAIASRTRDRAAEVARPNRRGWGLSRRPARCRSGLETPACRLP